MNKKVGRVGIVLFGLLSLFCGFVWGNATLEQVCQSLLLLSFAIYADKYSYEQIILSGFFIGSSYEVVDEVFKLNDGQVLIDDYKLTILWLIAVIALCLIKYKRQTN